MILQKLNEALVEIEAQRRSLDEAEKSLRQLIAQLSGGGLPSSGGSPVRVAAPPVFVPVPIESHRERDKFDEIVDVLRDEGRPLHIATIAERLTSKLGKAVKRQQIEPGINRHIQKVKQARIAKFGPSTFGLPEWKNPTMMAESAHVS